METNDQNAQAPIAAGAEQPLAALTQEQLQEIIEKQRQAAAEDWLTRVGTILNRKVTGFVLVALGPTQDGSIGVDRIGIVTGNEHDYREILAELSIVHRQLESSLMQMPLGQSPGVPVKVDVAAAPAPVAAAPAPAEGSQPAETPADFKVTDVPPAAPAPSQPVAEAGDSVPK